MGLTEWALRLSSAERERECGQALGPTSQRVKCCPGTPICARVSWDAGRAPPMHCTMHYLLKSCLPRKCIMEMGGALGELLKTALEVHQCGLLDRL
jgi:hypothetical protein